MNSSKLTYNQEYQKLAETVRRFYFGDAPIDEKVTTEYTEMMSDIDFDYSLYKSIRTHLTETNAKAYMIRYTRKFLSFLC